MLKNFAGFLRGSIYNRVVMDFLMHASVRIVSSLFFIGLAGSAIVVVVSFIEDLFELFGRGEN
jgi:hypothetical protein